MKFHTESVFEVEKYKILRPLKNVKKNIPVEYSPEHVCSGTCLGGLGDMLERFLEVLGHVWVVLGSNLRGLV